MDSLLNYVGHKSKIIDQIRPYFPTTVAGTFYDCFAGSCVVGLSVHYPQVSFVEVNTHLSQLYRDLTDAKFHARLAAIINQYGLTNSSVTPRSEYLKDPNIGNCQWMGKTITNLHLDQLNKPGYNQLIADFNAGKFTGIDKSCAYMIATIYGRNSNVTTKPDNTLSGAVGPLDFSIRCNEKLSEHQARLSAGNYTVITGSYDSITPTKDDFIYCDPPYLATGFKYGGWTETDEAKLLSWLSSLPCSWALSNTLQSGDRVNQLLTDFSENYFVTPIQKKYRKWGGSGTDSHKKKTKINREVLITNYQPTLGNGTITLV
jgi:site-specific DNA-adenine methylase